MGIYLDGAQVSEPFDFLPDSWNTFEKEVWSSSFTSVGAFDDRVAQALFNEGYFNFDIDSDQRVAIRQSLTDYMMREYGVDFDEIFDWNAWREAYGDAT